LKRYFDLRPKIRIILILLFGATLIGLNVYTYITLRVAPTLLPAFLLSAVTLLNEFSPEIAAWIRNRFGDPRHVRLIEELLARFQQFLTDYFLIIDPPPVPNPLPPTFIASAEQMITTIPNTPFGNSPMPDTRRRPGIILLFLILTWDDTRIDEYESRLAFVKNRYRDLTAKGKEECLCAYWHLTLAGHMFADPNLYFAPLSPEDMERARMHFLDRFSKDDYVAAIAAKLKLSETQLESFKSSLEAVARSGKFDVDHLKEYIRKRSQYRKLFVVTSDTKLPKRIQSYIRQNPHFILNWSSIANLPKIGLSRRFDIFFYAPRELVPSADAALRQFSEIDPSVLDHPIRIYEVDPSQATSAALAKGPHFAQAIRYFESSVIDTAEMGELSYPQLLAVLEAANVPLKDLLRELPIAEFSSGVYPEEKAFLEKLFRPIVTKDGAIDIFRAVGSTKAVRKRLAATKKAPVQYEPSHRNELFGTKLTLTKARSRLMDIAAEIVANIEAVDATLI
jgi:hypothetical protein